MGRNEVSLFSFITLQNQLHNTQMLYSITIYCLLQICPSVPFILANIVAEFVSFLKSYYCINVFLKFGSFVWYNSMTKFLTHQNL